MEVSVTVGRRERRRKEIADRIRKAAFDVFAREGFDNAKLKDIAEEADVAERTLFNYVTDKRDLLGFVLADEVMTISESLFPEERWDDPLKKQVMVAFRAYTELFVRYSPVSLMLFREAIWFNTTPQLKSYLDSREALLERLLAVVKYKQSEGQLMKGMNAVDAAWVILSVFMTNVRRWLIVEAPEQSAKFRSLVVKSTSCCKGCSLWPEADPLSIERP